MRRIIGHISYEAPRIFVYMLQQFEYDSRKFFMWWLAFPDLYAAQKRGKLTPTVRARGLLLIAYGVWLLFAVTGLGGAAYTGNPLFIIPALLASSASAISLAALSSVFDVLLVKPRQNAEINKAKARLHNQRAERIAVIGSYGKTSMKEMLATVLSECKEVKATPGNKNVLISHARWVNRTVRGNEDILIFEYGEAGPGDIAKLAGFSSPTIAVVTGLAPAHLDAYPSLEAVADDFAAISDAVDQESVYVHDDSALLMSKVRGLTYDQHGLGDWKVSKVSVDFSGTSFRLGNGKRILSLKSGLVGRHHIGPLCAVVDIAVRLGLSDEQIKAGVAATSPYEHRMQPRELHGAWLIDDTYNGNIEGMRAGLRLLDELPGKRKIYVTPGLVDQGVETEKVHIALGEMIAGASPDKIVLMQNSVTSYIRAGLDNGAYTGEVIIQPDPLAFYSNIEHFVVGGDVILMQNDWPDSYQ